MPIKKPANTKSAPLLRGNCRSLAEDPAVGRWADREDMKDVKTWLMNIRAPRYDRLGRRRP